MYVHVVNNGLLLKADGEDIISAKQANVLQHVLWDVELKARQIMMNSIL